MFQKLQWVAVCLTLTVLIAFTKTIATLTYFFMEDPHVLDHLFDNAKIFIFLFLSSFVLSALLSIALYIYLKVFYPFNDILQSLTDLASEHYETNIEKFKSKKGKLHEIYNALYIFRRATINNKRLASFPQMNPSPIVECDTELNILYANPVAEAEFPDLMVYENLSYLLNTKNMKKLEDAIEKETLLVFEQSINRQWYEFTTHVLTMTDQKKVVRFYTHNITHLRETNRHLEKARQEALRATEAKSEFLANMSHEIRTPMNGILGTTSLLARTDLDKTQQRYVKMVTSSGETLLEIINDILDISKIEAGQIELSLEYFEIKPALQSVFDLFDATTSQKGLQYIFEYDDDIPRILRGDHGRIRQILSNFIGNAIKFTKEGSINVTCQMLSDKANETVLRFEVQDTGIGILEDKLDSVFSQFQQVKEAQTPDIHGTGLGLSICKSLAELLGGKVGVSSELGSGSLFWAEIPFEKENTGSKDLPSLEITATALPLETSEFLQFENSHILLVEDVQTNQLIFANMLEHFGCSFDIANNGKEAIKYVEQRHRNNQKPYDLVFMDMRMPIMDGLQATEVLRQEELEDKTLDKLTIIALTAYAMNHHRDQALKAGMDDFLSKPIKIEDLYAMFVKWLGNGDTSEQTKIQTEKTSGNAP